MNSEEKEFISFQHDVYIFILKEKKLVEFFI